jgi:hypothetical protein
MPGIKGFSETSYRPFSHMLKQQEMRKHEMVVFFVLQEEGKRSFFTKHSMDRNAFIINTLRVMMPPGTTAVNVAGGT